MSVIYTARNCRFQGVLGRSRFPQPDPVPVNQSRERYGSRTGSYVLVVAGHPPIVRRRLRRHQLDGRRRRRRQVRFVRVFFHGHIRESTQQHVQRNHNRHDAFFQYKPVR